jgi:glycosyltransferase involved in cell wall biosynthesis
MQPPHAVPAYIAGADIGIIAREGTLENMRFSLPNRLFQMIAARLPVVVTPLPEIARVVQKSQVGLLFEEFDPIGMAAAILKMIEPATLARFQDAVDSAARSLVWERESVPYVRFVERVAKGAPIGTDVQRARLESVPGG